MKRHLDGVEELGFARASRRAVREADLFYADLMGAAPRVHTRARAPITTGPAFAFDEVVRRSTGPIVRFGEDAEAWEVIGRPATPVARGRLRDGDTILQRPAGEGRLTLVRTLGEDMSPHALFGADGHLRADTLVLRRTPAGGAVETVASADDGAFAVASDLIEIVPRAGRGSFRHAPLGGEAGDNVEARWNVDAATAAGSTIAVVVHLHGFGDVPRGTTTRDFLARKADAAGVDLADAAGTVRVRRALPTLALVPRGQPGAHSSWLFNRVLPDEPAFTALVDAGLAYLATTVLGLAPGSTLARGRLTVMAHSGGGAGLSTLLGHATRPLNPDEVVCFDSMYGGEQPIIGWATAKLALPDAASCGLRGFYTGCGAPSAANPGGRWVPDRQRTGWAYEQPGSWSFRNGHWQLLSTEVSARRLQSAIDRAIERLPVADRAALAARFRVERAGVEHPQIPGRYAPLLLDDIAATVPHASAPPAATSRPSCVRNDDWLTRPTLKPFGDDPPPPAPSDPPAAPVAEDAASAEDVYRPSSARSYAPSADPSLFRTSPTPVAVSPATEWPEPTTDADGAASRALRAAGASAATVAAYAGAGLAALRPIASVFGEAALTELLARLRYAPGQLASPPHSYDNDTKLSRAFRSGSHAVTVPRKTVLAMRLLLAIPGHFRQLARRTSDEAEAFALENLGWLIMGTLRGEVASATGADFWLPSAPPFVAGFPNPIPSLSDQVSRLVLRSGLVDDTQDLPGFFGRLGAWRAGAPGRMWRLETGRDPAAGRPLGAPFYPEPFTNPPSINTATQRGQVRTVWTRRVAAFDSGTTTRPLTDCDDALLAPLALLAPVSLGGLELRGHFPAPRAGAPIATLPGLAVVRPAFEAAFKALADVGWNDLVFETQGMGCFRGIKLPGNPAAARTMSEHSLGIAVDLNVFENEQNTPGAMDPRVVALFEAFRFRWGKGFPTPDPMHFEYAG